MKKIESQILNELEKLHHPQMTSLENYLKFCLSQKPELQDQILTSSQMSDYILWLIDHFGDRAKDLSLSDIPGMLSSEAISGVGQNILQHPKNPGIRKQLTALYENSLESHFFRETQDISAGCFLRYFPPYWRKDAYFEIYYVFSGKFPVYFEQETISLSPGDVLLIPPGIQKACTLPENDCMAFFFMLRKSTFRQVFWSHLSSRNLMSNFFHEALSGNGNTPYLKFQTGQDLWIELILYRIYTEYHQGQAYSSRLMNTFMSGFFLTLLQGYENTAQISSHTSFHWKPQFAEILRYIQENYSTVTLEDLTEKFSYSERQIIRIIKNSTGQNFSQLQTKLRMEHAGQLLKMQELSMESIAVEVGFSNLSSFHRAFVRYYGCTPGEYRKVKVSKSH
ncbi:MAG: helix-turn-helix transcriptional regulator [Blautia sp.]|nr:helix-turn-helix transcriptional regulator [Blautia sp.]